MQVVKNTSYVPFLRKLLQVVFVQNKGVNQEREEPWVQEKGFSAKERWKKSSGWLWRRPQDDSEMCASEVEDAGLDMASATLGETSSWGWNWLNSQMNHFERALTYLGESWVAGVGGRLCRHKYRENKADRAEGQLQSLAKGSTALLQYIAGLSREEHFRSFFF